MMNQVPMDADSAVLVVMKGEDIQVSTYGYPHSLTGLKQWMFKWLGGEVRSFVNTVEVNEVDLEKESELIANGIMISVQSNKSGTNVYNTERNDFNYYHLQKSARKGIEFGLKIKKVVK